MNDKYTMSSSPQKRRAAIKKLCIFNLAQIEANRVHTYLYLGLFQQLWGEERDKRWCTLPVNRGFKIYTDKMMK